MESNLSFTLQCVICMELPKEPQQCNNCQKPYCKNCINLWLRNNQNTCPHCKYEQPIFQPMNKLLQGLLNSIEVKCNLCNQNIEYQYTRQHEQNECPMTLIECPQECLNQGILRKDLNAHLQQCPMNRIICQQCGKNMLLRNLEAHNCLQELRMEYQEYVQKQTRNFEMVLKRLEEQEQVNRVLRNNLANNGGKQVCQGDKIKISFIKEENYQTAFKCHQCQQKWHMICSDCNNNFQQ